MNIGKECDASYNESNGVSLLKIKLQKNNLIKCYFGEGEKTPNTDGYFVVNNASYPIKEIHVQIKTCDILRITKQQKVYTCDTKFINYANLKVTENPCMIFVIEMQTKKIYFKYLSDKFLTENNFLDTEQKDVSIHFSEEEILKDISTFYPLICDIIKSRRIERFSPSQIDLIEFQNAFDVLNDFFDNDFKAIKELLYPNVWKFGISYQRQSIDDKHFQEIQKERSEMGIKTLPSITSFGAYTIEYGDNQNIFQNIDPYEENLDLKLQNCITFNNGIPSTAEEETLFWLENTFKNWLINPVVFLPFMPNDALFEIIYNFLDKEATVNPLLRKVGYNDVYQFDNIETETAKEIIINKYPTHYMNKDICLLQAAIIEIETREIKKINRIWHHKLPLNTRIPNYCGLDIENLRHDTKNFFQLIPTYYNEFIYRLFKKQAEKYTLKERYIYNFNIGFENDIFKNEYKSICQDSSEYIVDIVDDIDKNIPYKNSSWGLLNVSFKGDKNNILNKLLYILYKKVCKIYGFKEDISLQFMS